jgi:hypothetical protein
VDTPTSTPQSETRPVGVRWLRWLAGTALAVPLLAVLLFLVWQRQAADRLRLALKELDRTDPSWRLADVEAAREPVPDAENGALLASAVGRMLPKLWPPRTLDDFGRRPTPERWTPEERALLETELKSVQPAVESARGLALLPKGRFPLHYAHNPILTLLPDQQEARRVVGLLAFDAGLRADAGDMKGAVQSCRAAFHAAAALSDEPTLISQLIRMACVAVSCGAAERVLAQGEPDPKDLEELQQDLEREDAHNGLLAALRGERATLHEVFALVESGEVPVKGLFAGLGGGESPQDRFLPWLTQNEVRAEHPLLLSLMTRRIEAAAGPVHEQAEPDRVFDAEVKALPARARLTRLLLPALSKISDAYRRQHAQVRCLMAAVAAERYRRAHGTWPKALGELSPAFLAAVPLDPYDGAPLRYKRLAGGIVVYSLGPDGADNGGTLDRENPIRPGTDLGCQLWDVANRRRPPSPAPPAAGSP